MNEIAPGNIFQACGALKNPRVAWKYTRIMAVLTDNYFKPLPCTSKIPGLHDSTHR
jgi:hypothetical protein